MKPKFKKGDKVRTKKTLKVNGTYEAMLFLKSMKIESDTIREETTAGTFTTEKSPYYYAPSMLTKIK